MNVCRTPKDIKSKSEQKKFGRKEKKHQLRLATPTTDDVTFANKNKSAASSFAAGDVSAAEPSSNTEVKGTEVLYFYCNLRGHDLRVCVWRFYIQA